MDVGILLRGNPEVDLTLIGFEGGSKVDPEYEE